MDEFRPTRRQVLAAGAGGSFLAAFTRWAAPAGGAPGGDPAPTDPADLTLVEILPAHGSRTDRLLPPSHRW